MSIKLAILGSGSSGNSAYLEADGFGLLIDLGFGPRQLETRMAKIGISWAQVDAVLLTHTHRDHWNDRSFGQLKKRDIPVYCHLEHQRFLSAESHHYFRLSAENLAPAYEPDEPFQLTPNLTCLPFAVPHDSGLTFGFRFEGPTDWFGETLSLAYASDLGTWNRRVAHAMADVDLLAVEFNHDVSMQKKSRRSAQTIARNLGDRGHLSNEHATALVQEAMRLSEPGRLQHVVQLHLSKECNKPDLAATALEKAIADAGGAVQIHAANQHEPGPVLTIGEVRRPRRPANSDKNVEAGRPAESISGFVQPMLPGLDG